MFLSGENALFEVDAPFGQDVDRWARHGTFGMEEFLASLEGSRVEQERAFADLLQRHIVVPVEEIPHRGAAHVHMPVRTLVLSLTDACNLSCDYCYHAARRSFPRTLTWMSEEVGRRAIDFLIESSGPVRDLTVVFFGGEPLLHFEVLSLIAGYARSREKVTNKRFSFALTTNGTLCSDQIMRLLKEERFAVTVSIDGPSHFENRHRRFVDGTPAHDAVLGNVLTLARGEYAVPAVARVTLTNPFQGLSEVLEGLLAAGFCEVGFGPVTTNDPALQLGTDALEVLLREFRRLAERTLEAAMRGELYGFSNLIDLLVTLHEGDVKHYPCGAGLGLFSVDQRGGLYLCQRFTGEESFCVGDVYRGFDSVKLASFRKEAEVTRRGACRECWVRNFCAGGCYHEAWVREGDPFVPTAHYCEWIKEWVRMGLEVYARMALACPDYLERLSRLRGRRNPEGDHFIPKENTCQ